MPFDADMDAILGMVDSDISAMFGQQGLTPSAQMRLQDPDFSTVDDLFSNQTSMSSLAPGGGGDLAQSLESVRGLFAPSPLQPPTLQSAPSPSRPFLTTSRAPPSDSKASAAPSNRQPTEPPAPVIREVQSTDYSEEAFQRIRNVPFAQLIRAEAERNNLNPILLAALIRAESNFNASAVSSAGATGLTQLMEGTARGLGVTNRLDPAENVRGGARYLREQLDRFGGDVEKALAAYNAGPGAVQKHGGIPPFRETQAYVPRVLQYLRDYENGR